jgi:hypothetical protein
MAKSKKRKPSKMGSPGTKPPPKLEVTSVYLSSY